MTRDEKRQAWQMWIGSMGVAQATFEVNPDDIKEALYGQDFETLKSYLESA